MTWKSGNEAVQVQRIITEEGKSIISSNLSNLIKPEDYKYKLKDDNTGVFEIEPLEKGFGITLGNSLRRVLLSALQGFAVTAIRIEGVEHEHKTIPGVYEEVGDIILNIKGIILKHSGTDKKKLTLKASGSTVVTAGMIEVPPEIEIVNKDHVIANLDGNAKLKIEFYVNSGKGYRTFADNRTPEMPLGMIPIDSIFTPVKRVSFNVEHSRVGSETEYDKLILVVQTNGSIAPDLAVGFAAKILQEQFKVFVKFKDVTELPAGEQEEFPIPVDLLRKLVKKVDELELSVRSSNCLKNDNIRYVGDLIQKTEGEMLRTPNFGRKSLHEIREVLLREFGLELGMAIPGWPPENVEELIEKLEKLNQ